MSLALRAARFVALLASPALCFVAAGCLSSKPTSKVVPLASLEQNYRSVLEAYGEGGEAWEAARAEALDDPKLTRFLVDNLAREMVRAFESGGQVLLAAEDNPYIRAREELIELGAPTVNLAAGMLAEGDDVLAYHGADLIEGIGEPAVPALVDLLRDSRDSVRRRAAGVAGGLDAGSPALERALTDLLTRDSEWIVRAQAARAIGTRLAEQRAAATEREHLSACLEVATRDEDILVAAEAALALGPLQDLRAAPALIEVLDRAEGEGHPLAARRAQTALQTLFADPTPRGSGGWQAYWKGHPQRR